MKVVSLSVENVKRIRKVVITPKGYAVKVAGPNRAGKSSAIDSLKYLLEGTAALPGCPVREGEEKARIAGDFGTFEVTRTITAKGTTVTVRDEDGKVEKPQMYLDKLLGSASTDALQFFQNNTKKQRELVSVLCGIDTTELDQKRKSKEDDRLVAGRKVKELEGKVAGRTIDEDAPDEEASASNIVAELDKAKSNNESMERGVTYIEDESKKVSTLERDIENVKEALALAEQQLETARENVTKAHGRLAKMMKVELGPIQARLDGIEETNQEVRGNAELRQLRADLRAKRAEHEDSDDAIKAIDKEKAAAVQGVEYPIEGLSVDDEAVLYNGIPIDQISAAEKVMVGIAIVSKLIPEDGLRVLRVSDASLLDEDSMKKVEALAEEQKVQVWLELVDDDESSSDATIFIRDGRAAQ